MTTETSLKALEWTGERYLPEIGGSIELEHLHRYLFAREFVAGKRVLDIASGEGYGSALLADAAGSVIGVDISEDAVAFAKSKYSRSNLEFRAGSCAAIPLGDHCIDVVVSFETIEHHTQHEQMMLEIKRVLTPGGILIISCPDKLEYSDRPGYSNPYHVRELYRDEFKSLLDQHFAQHNLLGQRIVYGSAVVAEEGASEFLSIVTSSNRQTFEKGLDKAVYLIALATDGLLPELKTSLFEQSIMDSDAVRGFQSELATLHKTVGARDKAIDDVNRALVFCNKAIVDLRNSHINRDAMIEVLFDRLNKLQAEYETLKTEYENVCLHRNRTPNTTR